MSSVISVVASVATPYMSTNQFAKVVETVHAFDIDPNKILYLMNNAQIYGVSENIKPQVLPMEKSSTTADFSFASPPWGGISYINTYKYSVAKFN